MLRKEQIIERMARAIWEANGNKGATWDELLILKSKDGYLVAKTTFKITMEQAEAALNALLDSLPELKKDMVLHEDGDIVPRSWLHDYEGAFENYKELLAMKGK